MYYRFEKIKKRYKSSLNGLDTDGKFSAIFREETTFVTSCLAILHIKLILKRGTALKGRIFRFIVDLFRREVKTFWQVTSFESVFILLL